MHMAEWPEWDEGMICSDIVTVVVQVNGRVRSTLQIRNLNIEAPDGQQEVIKLAMNDEKVARWLEGKKVVKEIWIPPKNGGNGLVNLVMKE